MEPAATSTNMANIIHLFNDTGFMRDLLQNIALGTLAYFNIMKQWAHKKHLHIFNAM